MLTSVPVPSPAPAPAAARRKPAGGSPADLPPAAAAAMSDDLRAAATLLCHAAADLDTPLYLVGGTLRDRVLLTPASGTTLGGALALDLDLAVGGDVSALVAALAGLRWTTHDRFGSASAQLPDGSRIDLVRTRSERYPAPAALPIVEAAPIERDLDRRDFTINAAAFGLSGPHAGVLLDPHGGGRDAARKVARVLHSGSFQDDPTRLIRLCRYAARIGGRPERETARLARQAVGQAVTGLAALSPARFGDAWRALLQDAAARQALRRARRLRLPQARLAGWEVSARAASVVEDGREDAPLRFWAAIGLSCRDPATIEQLPTAAALRREERAALQGGAALRAAKRKLARAARLSEAADLVTSIPPPAAETAAALWRGPAAERLRQIIERRDCAVSPLSGATLLALGVPQGPAVGAWQRRLAQAIWDAELPDDSAARIALAEQWVRSSPTRPPAGGPPGSGND